MGIYDRDYARPTKRGGMPPASGGRGGVPSLRMWSVTTWLIAINIAVFVIDQLLPNVINTRTGVPSNSILSAYGHFSTAKAFFWLAPQQGGGHAIQFGLEVWRVVTFQFLHANLTHVAFNMLGLYFFGGLVENFLGRRKFLAFYLMCGICGALLYVLLNLLGAIFGGIPGLLNNDFRSPMVGASAGVFGVIVACAYISPNSVVQLLIPPIPLRMKTFAYAYVAIAAVLLLWGANNKGGQAAHLGGAIAGFFFIRNSHYLRDFFDVFQNSSKPKQKRRSKRASGGEPSEAEIDRILAKVSAKGMQSLTAAERETLAQGSDSRRAG